MIFVDIENTINILGSLWHATPLHWYIIYQCKELAHCYFIILDALISYLGIIFRESRLKTQIEGYKARYGHYPEAVCADKIYRTRENLR